MSLNAAVTRVMKKRAENWLGVESGCVGCPQS